MVETKPFVVIGAGPYGLSLAALARERGIGTTVLGAPMSFWRKHMPAGMFLRSDAGWHFDAAERHTFRAYLEERGDRAEDLEPIPIGVYLDYADWFVRSKGLEIRDVRVRDVRRTDDRFEIELESGGTLRAERVAIAPGIERFASTPAWAGRISTRRRAHTFEAVGFDDVAGRRVVVIGGRQSAHEWAALLAEHGAERVDVVHRHDAPRFDTVSWTFTDDLVARTRAQRGWWRGLPADERDAIARRFWEAGRLTLEPWLVPRLERPNVRRWPRVEVVEAEDDEARGVASLRLSNGERLEADRVVFATGYRADLSRIPWLEGVRPRIRVREGFPELDEHLQTSLPGLHMTGFVATRDFGPFFGFVRATPASSALIVDGLLAGGRKERS